MPRLKKLSEQEYVEAPLPISAAAPPDNSSRPVNLVITWVDIDRPKPVPWNPPARTTRRAVLDIIRRMQEFGFEPFRPLLLSEDEYIGDGHRRWTAARYLQLPKVPAIYTGLTVEELWAGNLGARSPRAGEWMAAHILGRVEGLPTRTANAVDGLLMVLGEEGVRYLIERGQSPDIWRSAYKVGVYCANTETAFLRRATYWLVKHKMVDKTSKAMRGPEDERIDPRVLKQAIENDLPLRRAWDVS